MSASAGFLSSWSPAQTVSCTFACGTFITDAPAAVNHAVTPGRRGLSQRCWWRTRLLKPEIARPHARQAFPGDIAFEFRELPFRSDDEKDRFCCGLRVGIAIPERDRRDDTGQGLVEASEEPWILT